MREILILNPLMEQRPEGGAEQILAAAKLAHGSDILIIHKDSDAQTYEDTRKDRFIPGRRRVEEAIERGHPSICSQLVPVIPVRMTEAWMLADYEVLMEEIDCRLARRELMRSLRREDLALPEIPKHVEALLDPKRLLERIISLSKVRGLSRADLYGPLADKVRIEYLARVPSYSVFKSELRKALLSKGFIKAKKREGRK